MCQAFSCLVTRTKKVHWKAGVDSHDELVSLFKVRDDTDDKDKMKFVRIEIIPDHNNKYPYLYPDEKWKLKVDEQITPTWFRDEYEKLAWGAWEEWKKEIYSSFNYKEALNPINPLLIESGTPTKEDIVNLKKWDLVRASVRDSVWDSVRASVWASVRASVWASVRASVRASVGDSVWDSVRDSAWDSVRASVGDSVWDSVWDSVRDSAWDSVRASVWASVRAYTGSLYPNIKEWKHTEKLKTEGYPFQSCVDLWKRGFVPSFDGTTWRLHSGKDAKVVYELKKEKTVKEIKE